MPFLSRKRNVGLFFFFIDGHFKHPVWRRSYKRDWYGKLPWCKSITGEKLFSKGLPVVSIHFNKGKLIYGVNLCVSVKRLEHALG